jgi:hypothetical protein
MTAERLHKGECGFYSDTDIESMRAECCGHEYDKLVGSGDLCDILYEGVVGWKHIVVDEVVDYWEYNILPDHTSNIEVMKNGMETAKQSLDQKQAFEQQEISDRIERGEERPDE